MFDFHDPVETLESQARYERGCIGRMLAEESQLAEYYHEDFERLSGPSDNRFRDIEEFEDFQITEPQQEPDYPIHFEAIDTDFSARLLWSNTEWEKQYFREEAAEDYALEYLDDLENESFDEYWQLREQFIKRLAHANVYSVKLITLAMKFQCPSLLTELSAEIEAAEKRPISRNTSRAIAMGKFERVVVDGVVHIVLKKEVNV